ncbi:MAG: polymer-forming cytoskeletal protein [Spirochaetales bacterium]|nr:polymer-forming cytoskeletal protein [Spirochaetales bacterium]
MQGDIEVNSVIGENSVFEGRYSIKGNLRIDGQFEGESLFVDQLTVGAKGRVKTDIIATSVVIEGIVVGNISASRRILLLSSARVLGNIETPELIIQEGVILEGRCTISRMQIKNTKEYIESLYERNHDIQVRRGEGE